MSNRKQEFWLSAFIKVQMEIPVSHDSRGRKTQEVTNTLLGSPWNSGESLPKVIEALTAAGGWASCPQVVQGSEGTRLLWVIAHTGVRTQGCSCLWLIHVSVSNPKKFRFTKLVSALSGWADICSHLLKRVSQQSHLCYILAKTLAVLSQSWELERGWIQKQWNYLLEVIIFGCEKHLCLKDVDGSNSWKG